MKRKESLKIWRQKTVADLRGEIKTLRNKMMSVEEKDVHAKSKLRREVARLKTVIAEMIIISHEQG